MKRPIRERLLPLVPLLHAVLLAIAALLFVVAPAALILVNAKKLGYLWLPIMLVYAVFLCLVAYQLYRRVELLQERFYYGDEKFFQLYPRLRHYEVRKQRWRAFVERHLARRR